MHESGMMKDLLKQITAAVESQQGTRAVNVKVAVGLLTQMSPGHFRGHFEEAIPGTVAEGATLEVEMVDDMTDERALQVTLESVEVET